jgi:hypothetical protein
MRRLQLGQEQADTLRRWTNAFGLLALLLLTLNLAQIPLSVFAFAGGALAIGIGFGTQTLIKNLISGMIVLVERNIRVGDIIEVEGVTGTVTAVDVRSSTLRGFDGVETMIPNAMLLEQKVTNWTLTSAKLRRVVKVGVPYGSPLRDAARILAQCVDRHDAVLKDPAPQVLFEDFGDDACMLGAYFWDRSDAQRQRPGGDERDPLPGRRSVRQGRDWHRIPAARCPSRRGAAVEGGGGLRCRWRCGGIGPCRLRSFGGSEVDRIPRTTAVLRKPVVIAATSRSTQRRVVAEGATSSKSSWLAVP